jgi:hypothetical protein
VLTRTNLGLHGLGRRNARVLAEIVDLGERAVAIELVIAC